MLRPGFRISQGGRQCWWVWIGFSPIFFFDWFFCSWWEQEHNFCAWSLGNRAFRWKPSKDGLLWDSFLGVDLFDPWWHIRVSLKFGLDQCIYCPGTRRAHVDQVFSLNHDINCIPSGLDYWFQKESKTQANTHTCVYNPATFMLFCLLLDYISPDMWHFMKISEDALTEKLQGSWGRARSNFGACHSPSTGAKGKGWGAKYWSCRADHGGIELPRQGFCDTCTDQILWAQVISILFEMSKATAPQSETKDVHCDFMQQNSVKFNEKPGWFEWNANQHPMIEKNTYFRDGCFGTKCSHLACNWVSQKQPSVRIL